MKFNLNFFYKGSLLRYLTEKSLKHLNLKGDVLDIGGGENSRYRNLLKQNVRIDSINIDSKIKPTYVCDLNKLDIHINKKYDWVISVHTLEHIYISENLLSLALNSLKKNGTFYLAVPFLYRVHGHPFDYNRFTSDFYIKNLTEKNFRDILVIPLGFGVFSAAYALLEPIFSRIYLYPINIFLRIVFLNLDLFLTKISKKFKKYYGPNVFPIGYLVYAKK